jgi:endoglucanase
MNQASLLRAEPARNTRQIVRGETNHRWGKRGFVTLCVAILAAALVVVTLSEPQSAEAAGVNLEVRQSESATPLPSGTSLYADASADGGKAVAYDSAATVNYVFGVSSDHRVTQVTLRSRNSSQSGASDTINIVVDGTAQAAKTIGATATTYQDRSWSVNLGPGNHTIGVRGSDLSGARRLYSDRLVLSGDITSTPPVTDTDGDGVPDSSDACPTQAGTSTNNGCPVSGTSSNPFAGAKFYVDPSSDAAQTEAQWRAAGRTADADMMHKIASQPSDPYYFAEWTEQYDGIRFYVKYYADKWNADGSLPVFGLYAVPNRDCGSYSGGGFTTAEQYKAWIDKAALGQQDYGKKIIWILEPDALASSCFDSSRAQLLSYAVQKLQGPLGKVYIDAGHPAWRSADTMISRLQAANIANAQGFSLNVSNFMTTQSNVDYCKQISAGVGGKHCVIDTSRNGLGPYTGGTHDGDCPDWANPPGRALGNRPTANTGIPEVDAFYWLKQAGASDADCGPFPRAGAWVPDMNDATYGANTYDALGLAKRAAW